MKWDRFQNILVVILVGILGGLFFIIVSGNVQDPTSHSLLVNIGGSLLSAAFIGIILDIIWSKERTKLENDELRPIYERLNEATTKLVKLEGQLEAFKQLGFNYCHPKRSEALKRFLEYSKEIIPSDDSEDLSKRPESPSKRTINIVSSSARGLIGYLDRDPQEVQQQWRDQITAYKTHFRILLTHPAFAHLRQPAEERSSGDIELEILKTAIYFHCVAGMNGGQLRFYRGSPTVFAIQAGKHYLLNPYPHGQMAMDTLCLEFESEDEQSYISKFMNMHFNHTWAFIRQPSKLVDDKPLVVGINIFDDIILAFAECTYLNNPLRLRLKKSQVNELDTFTCKTLAEQNSKFSVKPPENNPFEEYVTKNKLQYSDEVKVSNE